MQSSLQISKGIYNELIKMNWCLCEATSDMYFITSDAPVVPFVLNKFGHASVGVGYGIEAVEISMPISPNLCILMTRKPIQEYIAVTNEFVKEINKRTALNAERITISSINSKYVQNLNNWAKQSLSKSKIDKDRLLYLQEAWDD